MQRLAVCVDRDGDRHVVHLELVDGLHAEVLEREHARLADRLGHQIGGAADGDEIRRLVFADRLDRRRPALGLAYHGDEARAPEHQVGELVHARRRGWTRRADHFVAHWIDRADVVDHAVGEVHRQLLAAREHLLDALVRRVAAGEQLTVE